MKKITTEKLKALEDNIASLKKVIIAYSGGVDSTFLTFVARKILGTDSLAITINAPFIPRWEVEEAKEMAVKYDFRHKIIETDIIDDEDFINNSTNRCYVCKKTLFKFLLQFKELMNYEAVCDGSNADDSGEFRPGAKALAELGVKSPLKDVGLSKDEIRLLSKEYDLPTYNKPSYACLASRFPYGSQLSREALKRVEEAEEVLFKLGFSGHRVRDHFPIARIEISNEQSYLLDEPAKKRQVVKLLKKSGYKFVTLDLEGYRTGCYDDIDED